MQLIIETGFLEEFVKAENKDFWYADFFRFLTEKAIGFYMTINVADEAALRIARKENPLISEILHHTAIVEYLPSLSLEIEQPSFYTRNSVFKLFCTTKTDVECKDLQEKYGYMYLNINTLKDKWALFQSDRDDASLAIDTTSNPRFDNWAAIQAFKHPIRSMIISDLYLLDNSQTPPTDPNKVDKTQPLDKNLYPLLLNLLEDVALENPLELLLLVKKSAIDTQNRIPFLPAFPNNKLQKMGKEIETFFQDNFTKLKVNLTIVHYTGSLQPNEKEHDRGIYTNYFFFEIGAGINLFNSSNQLRNRSTLNTHFLLKLPGKNIGFSGLRSFRDYIDSVVISHGATSLDYFYNYSGNLLLSDSAL